MSIFLKAKLDFEDHSLSRWLVPAAVVILLKIQKLQPILNPSNFNQTHPTLKVTFCLSCKINTVTLSVNGRSYNNSDKTLKRLKKIYLQGGP